MLRVPERLPLHFIISDAMVDESLVPHRIQGGFKGLGAKLVSLRARRGGNTFIRQDDKIKTKSSVSMSMNG